MTRQAIEIQIHQIHAECWCASCFWRPSLLVKRTNRLPADACAAVRGFRLNEN